MWELQICKNCGNTVYDTLEVFADAIGQGIYCRDCRAVTRLVLDRARCVTPIAARAVALIDDGTRVISAEAYRREEGIEHALLPPQVAVIEERAFFSCERLLTVAIPRGVREIGRSAFHGCRRLSEIDLPAGLVRIGRRAFRGCTSLISLILPVSLLEIGLDGFADCKSLRRLALPKGVRELEDNEVFGGCDSLREISFGGSAEKWEMLLGGKTLTVPTSSGSLITPKIYFLDVKE